MRNIKLPVLIVGAGPAGLATALDLGWRGISCLVMDRESDQAAAINVHPRAAAVTPRTMEFCRRWGVAEAVRATGFPRDYTPNVVYCTTLTGHTLFTQRFESMAQRKPLVQSPEARERCPQIWFDPVLEARLKDFPAVTVSRSWQLDSFVDEGHQVRAQITDLSTDEAIEVCCDYMIACDGPTSPIRDRLGISAAGHGTLSYSMNAVLDIPDFFQSHDKGQAERYLFIDGRGTWANLTVIDGRERFRFTLTGSEAALDRASVDMPAQIRAAFGADLPFRIVAIAPWRRREAVSERFRSGRIFLAGDAAHTIPPNLGMGMNTGVGDAFDLGWKIEAMLRGWGGAHLLDSYELERRPTAVRVAAESTKAYQRWMMTSADHAAIGADGEAGRLARERVVAMLDAALPHGWDTLGLQLGYRYDDSPICIPDGSPLPAGSSDLQTYVQTARPGARAPHAWLADGRSTLDLFGRGFTLLRFNGADTADLQHEARRRGVPLSVVDISDGAIRELYAAGLVLVRPDGHVAWRGEALPAQTGQLLDVVRGELQAGQAAFAATLQ